MTTTRLTLCLNGRKKCEIAICSDFSLNFIACAWLESIFQALIVQLEPAAFQVGKGVP
jgi:hypothetical protein